jgi:hydrogenase maturation protease
MSGRDQPLVLVAGIGNPDRGDDGLGRAVARRLRARVPTGVRILKRSGDILALIEDWRGFSSVIVVDAVTPISEPGRIHRFELTDRPLPIAFAPRSTHAFGVAETVELARSLGPVSVPRPPYSDRAGPRVRIPSPSCGEWISQSGRLSIPAKFRKAVGLERGGEVVMNRQ